MARVCLPTRVVSGPTPVVMLSSSSGSPSLLPIGGHSPGANCRMHNRMLPRNRRKTMKLFHNKVLGRILAVLFGLAAASYFAWTFSYFGLWLGERFQGVFPEAPTTVGLICGFVMFLAVLYSYFYI